MILRVFEESSGLIEGILRVYLGLFCGYSGLFWGILKDFGPIWVMRFLSSLSGVILRLFEGVSGLIEGIMRYFRHTQGSF